MQRIMQKNITRALTSIFILNITLVLETKRVGENSVVGLGQQFQSMKKRQHSWTILIIKNVHLGR